ncbi:superoxide dismutase [Candidatus Persebacteraceae bacterium Df01]|jgi:Fe-Mn family superoxide dismutase|uniref:Superoxide dismutase n=1 Tax=Candidatus Doriopsillibacter californiensis TaxID=2970740 RepID=A0ABT7QMY1_9GAMM|nr:superoxide dismutase [Candidatus Persebacteraceae bacterium Df01]
MGFQFADLPYDYDALEPHIDAKTMKIHYSKHHRAYFDKMSEALNGSEASLMSIERLLSGISTLGSIARNNAGGNYNHNIYWSSMSPDGGGDPVGALAGEIDRSFGGADGLRKEITAAGISRFGSGFAWLIVQERKLKVVSTPNQDNPLMDEVSESCRGIPVLALDVWEHAYYLKHQNRRPDYIADFWKIADWQSASKRFEAAMDKEK